MAAPTVRAVGPTTSTGAAGTAIDVVAPTATVVGDLMIAFVFVNNNNDPTPPTGWTLIRSHSWDANGKKYTSWRKVAETGDPGATFRWVASAGALTRTGVILAITGYDTVATNPIDVSSGNSGTTSTSIVATGVTTTIADTLLLWFGGMEGAGQSITVPSGMASQYAINGGGGRSNAGASEAFVGPGATGNRTGTIGTAVNNAAQLLAVRPAAAGGTVYTRTLTASTATAAAAALLMTFGRTVMALTTGVATMVRRQGRAMAASSGSALALVKAQRRSITATTGSTAILTVAKAFLQALTAATGSATTVVKRQLRVLLAATGSVVDVIKRQERRIAVVTGSAVTVLKGQMRRITATTGSAAGAAVARTLRLALAAITTSAAALRRLQPLVLVALTIDAAVMVRRQGRVIAVVTGSAVTVLKGQMRLITASTGSVLTVTKAFLRTITATTGSAATVVKRQLRALLSVTGSVVDVIKRQERRIAVVTGSAVTVLKGQMRLITASTGSVLTVTKAFLRTITATTGSAATVVKRQLRALLSVTESVVGLQKTQRRIMAATTASIAVLTRLQFRVLTATTGSVAVLRRLGFRTLAALTASVAALTVRQSLVRTLTAATASVVGLQLSLGKIIRAVTGSAVTLGRGLGLSLRASTGSVVALVRRLFLFLSATTFGAAVMSRFQFTSRSLFASSESFVALQAVLPREYRATTTAVGTLSMTVRAPTFKGVAFARVDKTGGNIRHFSAALDSLHDATSRTDHEFWEHPGQGFSGTRMDFVYKDHGVGPDPPLVPNKVTVSLVDPEGTVVSSVQKTNPDDGTVFTLHLSTTGDSAGVKCIGMYEVRLQAVKDNAILGAQNYDVVSTGLLGAPGVVRNSPTQVEVGSGYSVDLHPYPFKPRPYLKSLDGRPYKLQEAIGAPGMFVFGFGVEFTTETVDRSFTYKGPYTMYHTDPPSPNNQPKWLLTSSSDEQPVIDFAFPQSPVAVQHVIRILPPVGLGANVVPSSDPQAGFIKLPTSLSSTGLGVVRLSDYQVAIPFTADATVTPEVHLQINEDVLDLALVPPSFYRYTEDAAYIWGRALNAAGDSVGHLVDGKIRLQVERPGGAIVERRDLPYAFSGWSTTAADLADPPAPWDITPIMTVPEGVWALRAVVDMGVDNAEAVGTIEVVSPYQNDRQILILVPPTLRVGEPEDVRVEYRDVTGSRLALDGQPELRVYRLVTLEPEDTETTLATVETIEELEVGTMAQYEGANVWYREWTPSVTGVFMVEIRATYKTSELLEGKAVQV